MAHITGQVSVSCEDYISGKRILSVWPDIISFQQNIINSGPEQIRKHIEELLIHWERLSITPNNGSIILAACAVKVLLLTSGVYMAEIMDYVKNSGSFVSSPNPEEELYRWLCRLLDLTNPKRGVKQQQTWPLIQQVLDMIHEQYHDPSLCLKNISDLFAISPAYFGQLFKTQTGHYFNNYLADVRLNKAVGFLDESKLKVGEIAKKV
ncbi:hypothetical protein FACS1894141_1930 [Spirochaetia bacterium]|nr:hypothetical protein FACS1894141_1930 [Spirochaetia bacterium]